MCAYSDIGRYAMHTEMSCSVMVGSGGLVPVAHVVRSDADDSVWVARKRNDDQRSV